jgi:isoquinoline 1-oxidoreductase beta subunit
MMDLHSLIHAKPTATTRRTFLKSAPLAGLVLCVGLPGFGIAADEPQKYGGDGMPHGLQDSPKIFVAIGQDGTVSIVVHRHYCPVK